VSIIWSIRRGLGSSGGAPGLWLDRFLRRSRCANLIWVGSSKASELAALNWRNRMYPCEQTRFSRCNAARKGRSDSEAGRPTAEIVRLGLPETGQSREGVRNQLLRSVGVAFVAVDLKRVVPRPCQSHARLGCSRGPGEPTTELTRRRLVGRKNHPPRSAVRPCDCSSIAKCERRHPRDSRSRDCDHVGLERAIGW
jgi:hypothetical protein